MGVIDKVKEMFSDPEENCYTEGTEHLNDSTDIKSLELHEYAWIATGIATVISVVLSVYLIYKHCVNYNSKYQQRFIVRILLMVPIYSMDSFLSFRLYPYAIYFDLLRDCYEAFVINTFFCLLIEYSGGYQHTKEILAKNETVQLIFPLTCIRINPKRGFLRILKKLTLQYVIIRPILSLCAVILQSAGLYCPGNWNFSRGYIYITAIIFISVTLAMYALIQFYTLAGDEMKEHKPLRKFLAVKFVVFLTFWQSIAVAGLVYVHLIKATSGWTTDNIAEGIQNALICAEMLAAALIHISVFSHEPYVQPGVKTPLIASLRHAFNPYDIFWDIFFSFYPSPKRGSVSQSPVLGRRPVELKDVAVEPTTNNGLYRSPSISSTLNENNNNNNNNDAILHTQSEIVSDAPISKEPIAKSPSVGRKNNRDKHVTYHQHSRKDNTDYESFENTL